MSVYQGLTAREFTTEMQEVGYPVLSTETTSDSVVIVTARHGGSRFVIFLPRSETRHFVAQFKKAFTDKPSLVALNRWNNEKRWPRVYADHEGDLTLDMVFPLIGVDSGYINSIFMLWEAAVQAVVDCEYLN